MKILLVTLAGIFTKTLSPDISEEDLGKEIRGLIEAKDARIAELVPLAEDGKAYREDLVKTYVANKAKLGEVAETPEAQNSLKQVAVGYPLDFLKSEVAHLQKRVEEKFPAEGQLSGDDRRDKSGDGKGTGDNPLVPEEKK